MAEPFVLTADGCAIFITSEGERHEKENFRTCVCDPAGAGGNPNRTDELGRVYPQIQETIVLPTPEGAVEDGFILQAEPLRDCLRSALIAPELKRTRKVVFSLCSTQVLSVVTTIPAVADRQVEKLVNANMEIYFPVDVKDYHLVWTPVGMETDENGTDVRSVQLWAVPNALLVRYYHLANELGLSVEAIDYCGNSFVSMVGASFAEAASDKQPAMKRLALSKLSTGKKKAGRRQSRNRSGNEAERVEIATATAVLEPPNQMAAIRCST